MLDSRFTETSLLCLGARGLTEASAEEWNKLPRVWMNMYRLETG